MSIFYIAVYDMLKGKKEREQDVEEDKKVGRKKGSLHLPILLFCL